MKRKKRLLFINPQNPLRPGLTANPSSNFPPLAFGILAALTPDDFEIKLIDENVEAFTYEDADLVGITAFTSAVNRAYEIAAQYKAKNIPVVMGGIHSSMRPEEALHYVDSVVTGEAESAWEEVIRDFLNGALKAIYRGVPLDLKDAPVPVRKLFHEKYIFAPVQTSRGCPMNCHFCSVTAFYGRKYRQRPVHDVLAELKAIPNRYIFFVDDNLIGYGRNSEMRAVSLFKGMVEQKLDKVWFCQSSLNFGFNNEVLQWAANSGCKMVFIGLESPDDTELKEMNKKLNVQMDYNTAFKNINKHGIAVLGAFIFGSENETKMSICKKADYIQKHNIDIVQATVLTPLPGTVLFNELYTHNKLLYTNFPKDWDRFDMSELTFRLNHLSLDTFRRAYHNCTKKFYSKWQITARFFKTWIHTGNIETALWAYNTNLNYRNISG